LQIVADLVEVLDGRADEDDEPLAHACSYTTGAPSAGCAARPIRVSQGARLGCAAVRELWTKSRWLVVAGVVAALVAWGMSSMSSPEIPQSALAAAPAGASIVMRVDVAAVT